jgi:hypothetical protein
MSCLFSAPWVFPKNPSQSEALCNVWEAGKPPVAELFGALEATLRVWRSSSFATWEREGRGDKGPQHHGQTYYYYYYYYYYYLPTNVRIPVGICYHTESDNSVDTKWDYMIILKYVNNMQVYWFFFGVFNKSVSTDQVIQHSNWKSHSYLTESTLLHHRHKYGLY